MGELQNHEWKSMWMNIIHHVTMFNIGGYDKTCIDYGLKPKKLNMFVKTRWIKCVSYIWFCFCFFLDFFFYRCMKIIIQLILVFDIRHCFMFYGFLIIIFHLIFYYSKMFDFSFNCYSMLFSTNIGVTKLCIISKHLGNMGGCC
jgi:hypothetical protein